MKRMLLAPLAGLTLMSGAAFAADLPMSAPVYKAPAVVAPVYSWSGCYIDGGGGYGMWDADHYGTNAVVGPFDLPSTSGGRGWLGRVGAGCDYQVAPKWIIGAFGDYDFENIHGNLVDTAGVPGGALVNEKENWSWAAGARLGYVLAPGILTYVDGGWTETHFQQNAFVNATTGAPTAFTLAGQRYNGWFLGSGFETSVSDYLPGLPNGLFLRTEYRFSSFSSKNDPVLPTPGPTAVGAAENIHPYVQTVTTSLVWKFNMFNWH
jgi:outer membrane immunogenic protein